MDFAFYCFHRWLDCDCDVYCFDSTSTDFPFSISPSSSPILPEGPITEQKAVKSAASAAVVITKVPLNTQVSVSSVSAVRNNEILSNLSVALRGAEALLKHTLLCYASQSVVDFLQDTTTDSDGTICVAVEPNVVVETYEAGLNNKDPSSGTSSGSDGDAVRAAHFMSFLIEKLWPNAVHANEDDGDEDLSPKRKQIKALVSETISDCDTIHAAFKLVCARWLLIFC